MAATTSPTHVGALAAATVKTVQLQGDFKAVEVLTDGTAEVFFTTDGTTAPTVGGNGCFRIPAVLCTKVAPVQDYSRPGTTTVKLISAGTPTVTVEGRAVSE